MKDNTTNLSNEEYYQLRNFKEKVVIEKNAVDVFYDDGYERFFFTSQNDVIEKLKNANESLKYRLKELKSKQKPKRTAKMGNQKANVFVIRCKNCDKFIPAMWGSIPKSDINLFCNCANPKLGKIELEKANVDK